MAVTFCVARNPDPDSTLPYLLRVPVPGQPLVLRARQTWPRTSKVYCHDAGDRWHDDLEVVEEVPIRDCAWRGRSIGRCLPVLGDSGAGWFSGNAAYGIHSQGSGNAAFFMPVGYLNDLGVTVFTG